MAPGKGRDASTSPAVSPFLAAGPAPVSHHHHHVDHPIPPRTEPCASNINKEKERENKDNLHLLRAALGTGDLGSGLWQQVGVDVRHDTTLGDDNVAEQLVEFLVVADGELKMAGDDTGLLVVTGSVTSKLEHFGSEVLQDSSEIDRGNYSIISTDYLNL